MSWLICVRIDYRFIDFRYFGTVEMRCPNAEYKMLMPTSPTSYTNITQITVSLYPVNSIERRIGFSFFYGIGKSSNSAAAAAAAAFNTKHSLGF